MDRFNFFLNLADQILEIAVIMYKRDRRTMVARIEHRFEDGVEQRWCGKCQQYKTCTGENSRFGKSSKTWDGLRPTCKDCLMEHNASHKEQRHAYNAEYWKNTKEEQSKKHKKWKEENKEHVQEYMRKYREKHGKEIDKRDWQKRKNSEEYRLYHNNYVREWCKKQRVENPQYKLKSNISRRIRECLQTRTMSASKYVGCSILQLQCHLEKQFDEYMTWENQGIWHIDHRIPASSFDLTNPIEKMACFHYTNLQPMWGGENIRKSNRYNAHDKHEYLKQWLVLCVF